MEYYGWYFKTRNIFCVYELGGKTPATSGSEVVELKICSPELLRNHRTRVSKAYEETIDKIVTSILENPKYINTKKALIKKKFLSPQFQPQFLNLNSPPTPTPQPLF